MSEFPQFKSGDLFCLANDDGRDHPIGCIGTNGSPHGFECYAVGYFEAARILLITIHKDRYFLDPLVYPLCFLYRQGIELSLKHLLKDIPGLFCENFMTNKDHKLLENWIILRAYLVRQRITYTAEPLLSESTLEWIDAVLKDFDSIDPSSLVFRYPEDKHSKQYLQDKSHVNYTKLRKFMEPLSQWFEGMIYMTDKLLYGALPG